MVAYYIVYIYFLFGMPGGGVTQSSTRIQSILSNWTGGDFFMQFISCFLFDIETETSSD